MAGRLKVTVADDGTVKVKALEGSFDEASQDIVDLLALLGGQGIELTAETAIEQHRHDNVGETHVHHS